MPDCARQAHCHPLLVQTGSARWYSGCELALSDRQTARAGPFTVWNEPDEGALLRRWFAHMREVQPAIYVTYNGDFFDWPFLETRAAARGLDMRAETGFRMSTQSAKSKECLSR